MKKTPFAAVLCIFMLSLPIHLLRAQDDSASGHQHMKATCVEVPAGTKRPDFGCFLVAAVTGLQFSQPSIYWHLATFPNRAAAEAAKTPAGAVVEEEGKVWLSEFGAKDLRLGGQHVAVIGPLQLLPAKTYDAEIAYAVLRPGDRSRVHTHAGPEAWYVLAGEQCLETPGRARKAVAGQTMFVEPSVPMELTITGAGVRRALALVVHDSAKDWGTESMWKPAGECTK